MANSPQPDGLMQEISRAHAEGRLQDCVALCQSALSANSTHSGALLWLGIALAELGGFEGAEANLGKVVTLDPASFLGHLWLSIVYRSTNRGEEAWASAGRAISINPNQPLARQQVGLCCLDRKDYVQAETYFRQGIALAPKVGDLHYNLGLAFKGQGRNRDAISAFRGALNLNPNSLDAALMLREAVSDENSLGESVEASRRVVQLQPESAEAKLWLARVLLENGNAEEADSTVREAETMIPDSPLACTLLGTALQYRGDIGGADFQFRKAIEMRPDQGSAYLAFSQNRKITEADSAMVQQMRDLAKSGELTPYHQSQLHYGLGKAEEDLGEYEAAMNDYDEANRLTYILKFGDKPFDRKFFQAVDEHIIRTFSPEFLAQYKGGASQSSRPIFVVGMIRSGTTLAEQILSSHPKIGGAGELSFWVENLNTAVSSSGKSLDLHLLSRLAERYERKLQSLAPGMPRVVDKMPMNYQSIGLIRLAFPNAKIISMVRHPIDTCISIYATPNRTRFSWGHVKANIVTAYQQYQKLMNHWEKVLPAGAILEVHYEKLVADRETATREMIEFCEAPWNDACLAPEKNKRVVTTPSAWQVRQPVYRTSIERWRKFEPWLGPFATLSSTP